MSNHVIYKLLEQFDAAAQEWGWAQDQGTPLRASETQQAYDKAREVLLDVIDDLITY